MDYKKAKISQLLQLSKEDIQKLSTDDKVVVLEKLVKYHNNQYFLHNSPVISDEYFDELTELLRKLKPDSAVLFELVGDIGSIQHPRPMLSIDKRYSYEDVKKWVISIDDTHFLVEPKYDGMAARYSDGVLATRGNGTMGEDISERFKLLKVIGDLEKAIQNDPNASAYGEIVIPTKYFEEHLAKDYKNPRNATVGIVKAKNITAAGIKALQDKGVHFVLYDQKYSLKVKKEDLLNQEQWESILEETFHSPYLLDGIVIKATDPILKEKLGSTAHHDRWQVAYKVPAEKKWSKVVNVIDSVGRTGRITSIAQIEPIQLSGATVTNVTLHNYEYLKNSKIGVGSKVEVMRSGEVIPFLTQVEASSKPHNPPKECPVCNTKLIENGKYLECPNNDCPARLSQSIEYFFKVLGVEDLGLKTIEKFIEVFNLKSVIDFYNLKEEQIEVLDGFGKKSAGNIVNSIQGTLDNKIAPQQLIQALGIKEIGPSTSRWIINHFGFWNLPDLTIEQIQGIKGMGPRKAESFVTDLKDKWWIVEELKEKGLRFVEEVKSSKLEGLSFAITGKKEQYSRDELIEMINKNGGEYKSSVTKGLNYLIAGDDGGSKLQKAEEVGAKIISEGEFLNLLDSHRS